MFQTSAVIEITDENCVGCRRCVNVCPSDALQMHGRLAVLDRPKCVGCFKCVEACYPYNAISVVADPEPRVLTVPEPQYQQPAVDDLCRSARLAPDAIVCICTRTTAAEIAAAVVAGATEPEELTLATGVRSICGMWCLTPTMRLLAAHGVHVERSDKDHRLYPDGAGTNVAIWTVPDEVADKYPEYRLRENRAAVDDGTALNSPTPWFPDIQPAVPESSGSPR
jgi:Fe-S-cluster-containing hydrogenase component 2